MKVDLTPRFSLVNKMIQGKKLMLDSMKELEKYQGTDEPEEKG